MELDPPRLLLMELIADRETDLKTVSIAMGRNHAYLQQYLKRGKPRDLPEDARTQLGEHFNIDPDRFRRPRKQLGRPGLSETPEAFTHAAMADVSRRGEFFTPREVISRMTENREATAGAGTATVLQQPGDRIKPATARRMGKARPPHHGDDDSSVLEIRGELYAAISVYDVRASAGFGSINDHATPMHEHLFRMSWLREVSGADPSALAVVRVSGDSMWDTLHDGDHVLVDRTIKRVGRDGIYVFTIAGGEELLVKRLIRSARTKLITIKADNPRYPVEEGVQDEDILVGGRVIWLGRNVGG